jgi:hypothetical protein
MKTRKVNKIIEEAVELDVLRGYLKIDFQDDDTQLDRIRRSAREWCEKFTSRAIASAEVEYRVTAEEGNVFFADVVEVLSIDTDHKIDTFDGLMIEGVSKGDKITLTVIEKYNEGEIPTTLIEAILTVASDMYFNRTGDAGNWTKIATVLYPYKRYLYV